MAEIIIDFEPEPLNDSYFKVGPQGINIYKFAPFGGVYFNIGPRDTDSSYPYYEGIKNVYQRNTQYNEGVPLDLFYIWWNSRPDTDHPMGYYLSAIVGDADGAVAFRELSKYDEKEVYGIYENISGDTNYDEIEVAQSIPALYLSSADGVPLEATGVYLNIGPNYFGRADRFDSWKHSVLDYYIIVFVEENRIVILNDNVNNSWSKSDFGFAGTYTGQGTFSGTMTVETSLDISRVEYNLRSPTDSINSVQLNFEIVANNVFNIFEYLNRFYEDTDYIGQTPDLGVYLSISRTSPSGSISSVVYNSSALNYLDVFDAEYSTTYIYKMWITDKNGALLFSSDNYSPDMLYWQTRNTYSAPVIVLKDSEGQSIDTTLFVDYENRNNIVINAADTALTDPHISSYAWYMNGLLQCSTASATFILSSGDYEITVWVENVDGIKSFVTINVTVAEPVLDLSRFIPEANRTNPLIAAFLLAIGTDQRNEEYLEAEDRGLFTVVEWIRRIKNIEKLANPKEVDTKYIAQLGKLLGLSISRADLLDIRGDSIARALITEAIDWYKIKGTYEAVRVIALVYGLNIEIYDMYAKEESGTYSDFVWLSARDSKSLGSLGSLWFVGRTGNNPVGLGSEYFKSTHFGTVIQLDRIYTYTEITTNEGALSIPRSHLWYPEYGLGIQEHIEKTRPIHTVPHYTLRLYGKTDESGNVMIINNEIGNTDIRTKVLSWEAVSLYFDEILSSKLWGFDEEADAASDQKTFDKNVTTFLDSITIWKLGKGSKDRDDLTDASWTIEAGDIVASSLEDTTRSVHYRITDNAVRFWFEIPEDVLLGFALDGTLEGVSEIGLYSDNPGLYGAEPIVGCVFPDIYKKADNGLLVEIDVLRETSIDTPEVPVDVVGAGTLANPYKIYTVDGYEADGLTYKGLTDIDDAPSAYYRLMNDIDMIGTTYTTAIIAKNTLLYGTDYSGRMFNGNFDGNGFQIKNLTINSVGCFVGLFGMVSPQAVIKDLGMTGCSFSGDSYIGGLIGQNYGTVTNCFSTGIISGTGDNIGGLIGYQGLSDKNTNSYSTATVSGLTNVGGFIGYSYGLNDSCYSTGNVSGSYRIGGFIGYSYGAVNRNTNCYSTGNVSGTDYIGGFAGLRVYGNSTNCYSIGSVSGTGSNIGGFIGHDYASSTTDCFWDTETSGQATSSSGTGKTTAEMKDADTYTNWDFDTIWDIAAGAYPHLR